MTFWIVGKVRMIEHVSTQFNERFLVGSANTTSWLDGYARQERSLKRTVSVDTFRKILELEERYVRSVLGKAGLGRAKVVVTPCSKEAPTAAATSGENNWTRPGIETIAR